MVKIYIGHGNIIVKDEILITRVDLESFDLIRITNLLVHI